MDFIKGCTTNVLAVDGFATIPYCVYTLKQSGGENDPSVPSAVWKAVDDANGRMRERKYLVARDVSRAALWVFFPSWQGDPVELSLQLVKDLEADNTCLQLESRGELKSADLSKAIFRPAQSISQTQLTASTQLPPNLRGAQAVTARSVQANAQLSNVSTSLTEQQRNEILAAYEAFTMAVSAYISYHLARSQSIIPLNFRTFVGINGTGLEADGAGGTQGEQKYWIAKLDVCLATTGTLLISTHGYRNAPLRPLSAYLPAPQISNPSLVRLAPSGKIAKLVDGPIVQNLEIEGLRKRQKLGHSGESISAWKTYVSRWLSNKGIFLSKLDRDESWVRVELHRSNSIPVEDDKKSLAATSSKYLWPAALCLCYTTTDSPFDSLSSSGPSTLGTKVPTFHDLDAGLVWFESSQLSSCQGYRDPLDFAFQWFNEKPQRDKTLESLKKARQAEEEASRTQVDQSGGFPSSPLFARGGNFGDLQQVGGVYPTPPDAVITQAPPGPHPANSFQVEAPTGDQLHLGPPPGHLVGGPMDIDGSVVKLEQPGPDASNINAHQVGNYDSAPHDSTDDLFGDLDEDMFGSNGVTDADFNFFDDPGNEDLDDLLGLDQGDSNIGMCEIDAGSVKADTSPDQGQIPVDGSDAVLELKPSTEDTHREASVMLDQSLPSLKNEGMSDDVFGPNAAPQIQDSKNSLSLPKAAPSPPLSPVLLKRKLFPSPKDNPPHIMTPFKGEGYARRGSIFDPLDFNSRLNINDAKYNSAGRFNFPALEPATPNQQPSNAISTSTIRKRIEDINIRLPKKGRLSLSSPTKPKTLFRHYGRSPDMLIEPFSPISPDDSDSLSDISSEGDLDDSASATYHKSPSTMTVLKRKWDLQSQGPSVVGTPTEAADRDLEELAGQTGESSFLETDISFLLDFEPDPADWSLIHAPPPIERPHSSQFSSSLPPFYSVWPITGRDAPKHPITGDEQAIRYNSLTGDETIAIVQILADQIVKSTFDVTTDAKALDSRALCSLPPADRVLSPANVVKTSIQQLFSDPTECDLIKYTLIQDAPPEISQFSRPQPRQIPRKIHSPSTSASDRMGINDLNNQIFLIVPPHVRIRRHDSLWDLLPPAISFWEPLGLAPTSGPKDVLAHCIYPNIPDSEDMWNCADKFLDSVGQAYENCKLGTHYRGEAHDFRRGLLPAVLKDEITLERAIAAIQLACDTLGKGLWWLERSKDDKDRGKAFDREPPPLVDNYVVYIINPFDSPAAVWHICTAFWTVFQRYKDDLQVSCPTEIVLQVVPVKYVASFNSPVILEPNTLVSLAREVYDRCPPSASDEERIGALSIYAAPSVQLEETLPKAIQFRLTAEPPADLLHENSYMHVGYSLSSDGVWLVAAWTDNSGKHQSTVAYYLGLRSFTEVAREIWQTSIEIMQARRVHWKMCIARSGVMEKHEADAWISLASSLSPFPIATVLLTVDPSPPLTVTSTLPSPFPVTNAPSSSTPVSTPQPGVSPDQHGLTPVATPSDPTQDPNNDPDARLIDVTDETWGIILSHHLNNSNSLIEYRPALASGFLLKRCGDGQSPPSSGGCLSSAEPIPHGPVCVGVNLLWVGAASPGRGMTIGPDGAIVGTGIGGPTGPLSSSTGVPSQRMSPDAVLRELLVLYRKLGLLAKLKGLKGSQGGTVPWHVAAAARGVKGLEAVLGLQRI